MCMGTPSYPAYEPPKPPVYEQGPESPPDMVNDQVVPNINDPSQQEYHQNKNKGKHTTSQSSTKTNKAY